MLLDLSIEINVQNDGKVNDCHVYAEGHLKIIEVMTAMEMAMGCIRQKALICMEERGFSKDDPTLIDKINELQINDI
jgi:hypothetical protein